MKKYFIITGILQVIVALGAIPAGVGYLSDISGAHMGNSLEMLERSPLKNFLIPGLFLVLVHGFGNLFGAVLSFGRKPLAGLTAISLGLVLVLWIVIQVLWIGLSSFMQPLFLVIGLIEASMGFIIFKKSSLKSL